MSKEKTIPDPPAHIKKIIDDEFEDLKDTSEYPFSSRVAYRAGATFMYHRSEEELEERSVGFTEWLAGTKWKICPDTPEGEEQLWYYPDSEPFMPNEEKTTDDLYKFYINFILTPTNGK